MYDLKALGIETFDAAPTSLLIDEGKMCATGILSTTARDRQGDILEVSGIDTNNHRLNPIVLLEHGTAWPLPIGLTRNENGEYTVVIDGNTCTQTTYFSQHSEVAEQVFRLLCDKTLSGNSIGFRPIEVERLQADPEQGFPGGKHIIRCELLEATWTGLPANPECVTAILENGMIGGKALAPAIKSLLTPYKLPKKTWANGAKMDEQMSANDETTGGALRKDEQVPEQQQDEQQEESKAEPMGCSMLRSYHKCIKELVDTHQNALPQLEQEKVKKLLMKHLDDLNGKLDDVAKCFKDNYPDQKPLEGAKSDDNDQVDDEADDKERDDDEVQEPEDATKDDEMSEDEEKALKRLERTIRRRELMLGIA